VRRRRRSSSLPLSKRGSHTRRQSRGRWCRSHRRPAQYEELEQQTLIYKYLVASVPVPRDLVVPIRRGLGCLATRFCSPPTPPTRTWFSALSPAAILAVLLSGACSVPGFLTLCLFQSSVFCLDMLICSGNFFNP